MDLIRAVLWVSGLLVCAGCASTRSTEPAPPSNPNFVFQERCDFRAKTRTKVGAKKTACAGKTVGASCGQQATCLATEELGRITKNQPNRTKYFSCSCDHGAPPPFSQSSCQITGQCSEYGDVYSIEYDADSCPMDYECPVPSKRDPVWDNLACKPTENGSMVEFRRPCIRGKLSKNKSKPKRALQGLRGPQRRSDQVPILW